MAEGLGSGQRNQHRQPPDLPGGVRTDLHRIYRKVPAGRWRHPGHHPAFEGYLRIGHIDTAGDTRWWVDSSITEAVGGWLFPNETAARAAVGVLLRLRDDGLWCELSPLAYDPRTDIRQ